MFNKPYDIVVMVAIFAAVLATVGFGIQGVIDRGGTVGADESGFFNSTNARITNISYFAGTVSDAGEAIVGSEGADQESTGVLQVIQKGFSSLLSLGKTYIYAQESLNEANTIIKIPPVYLTLVIGVVLVTLMVIIYTWIRGSV